MDLLVVFNSQFLNDIVGSNFIHVEQYHLALPIKYCQYLHILYLPASIPIEIHQLESLLPNNTQQLASEDTMLNAIIIPYIPHLRKYFIV